MFDRYGHVAVVLRAAKNGGAFGRFKTRRTQMINHETELKLQAYLDGELSPGEAKTVADLLRRDAGAQALYQELRIAKSLLAENELERKLPESGEFYWSKIRRQIEREESTLADGLTEPAAF